MRVQRDNIKIGIIGCTASTEFIISELLKIEFIDIAIIITLNESDGSKKSRFKEFSYEKTGLSSKVIKISDFKNYDLEDLLSGLNLDVLVEIGWSLKIPKYILDMPKFGTVGIHNSLLPEFQGPASLNWALIWDFKEWGCTLFHLEEDFDDGDIIYQHSFEIDDSDDINTLFAKSDYFAYEMITRYLSCLPNKKIPRVTQDKSKISRTRKRSPNDSLINWSDSTRVIFNLIRATKHPYPNAFSFINGVKILFNDAVEAKGITGTPGTVLEIIENNILVATGSGAICLAEYYLEGGRTYTPKIGDKFVDQI